MSKGFLALHQITKWHGLLCLCLAILAALSRVHSPGSLLIPASLACANAWAVCLPNAGAHCIPGMPGCRYAIPASSRSCVWPDVCAHSHACKENAKQVRWLVQATGCNSPCACSGGRDASSQQQVAGMQLCSSDIKLNSLLIVNMQKDDCAWETDLHFAASPFEALRPSMS